VWLPVRKRRAVFVNEHVPDSPKESSSSTSMSDHDKIMAFQATKGYEVDRTAPKQGEPTTRINKYTKREEHWCGKCLNGGRWGNHDSNGHDEWYKDFLAKKAAAKAKKLSSETVSPNLAPSSMRKTNESTNVVAPATNILRRSFVSFHDDSDDESF
jgi:hypothetical protein